MKTILITGGTGMVGKALVKKLVGKKYKVIILTRSLQNLSNTENVQYALWDVKAGTIDTLAIQSADAIIHLAGAGVMDKKWDDAYKKEIEESRTLSSRLLISTMHNTPNTIKTIVSASAIGWYGADKKENYYFTEKEPADDAYLGEVCKKWEQSVEVAQGLGVRVCKLRIGIVLSKNGGAYKEFRAPMKFGVASVLGNGKQMVSWIHIDDLCNQFIFALENEKMNGSYNAVATNPVNNALLTHTIAKAVIGKFYLPLYVPTFMLKLILGSRSIEILKSTTVSNKKIIESGFTFLYPTVEDAVKEIEKK
jgi:uncharacterized protein